METEDHLISSFLSDHYANDERDRIDPIGSDLREFSLASPILSVERRNRPERKREMERKLGP